MYSYLARESACRVSGENDMHAVPQKVEQVLDLALGRWGRCVWLGIKMLCGPGGH